MSTDKSESKLSKNSWISITLSPKNTLPSDGTMSSRESARDQEFLTRPGGESTSFLNSSRPLAASEDGGDLPPKLDNSSNSEP